MNYKNYSKAVESAMIEIRQRLNVIGIRDILKPFSQAVLKKHPYNTLPKKEMDYVSLRLSSKKKVLQDQYLVHKSNIINEACTKFEVSRPFIEELMGVERIPEWS